MPVRVESGARLHFGFCNLSLAHERLYGSLGVALDEPRVVVRAARADAVDCDNERAREHAERAVDLLEVPGAAVTVESELPAHVGLGSGTQLALSVLASVARAHDRAPAARERAPELGRGGRSGVGVATFERGGFVLDGGHPVERFTTEQPPRGSWTVPPVAAHQEVPGDWRFLLVRPEVDPGPNDDAEDRQLRRAIEDADPAPADRVAGTVLRRVLPAVADGDQRRFGAGVAAVGRQNGTWYADEQGGVYRAPAGALVDSLRQAPAVYGAGQSSWGPLVYGVTDAGHAEAAAAAGRSALEAAGVDGAVQVVEPRNEGARFEVA